MSYSAVGIVAIIINLLINRDVLRSSRLENETAVQRDYRLFICAVIAYLATDALWGIIEALNVPVLLYIDTVIHFIAMYLAVLFWIRFAVVYLNGGDIFSRVLLAFGNILFVTELVALVANHFVRDHFFFWIDSSGGYQAYWFRYLALSVQMALFLTTSVYAFLKARKATDETIARRYRTIGLFGVTMAAAIVIQVVFPLMPYYAIGYMIGTCILHIFVVEEENEELRKTDNLVQMFVSEYAAAFIGNLKNGTCRVLSNRYNAPEFSVGSFTSDAEIKKHVSETAYPADLEKLKGSIIEFADIVEKLPAGETHTVEYRAWESDGYLWYRAMLRRISDDTVLIGFKQCDEEVRARIVEEKLMGEYDAIYVVDLDRNEIRPARSSRVSSVGAISEKTEYSALIRKFAGTVAPQYRQDWIRFSDPAFMKGYMAETDHREYIYELPETKNTMRRFNVDVLERVNGEAAVLLFSFTGIDDYQAQTILLQRKMAENSRIIGALSEDFGCVNYVEFTDDKIEDVGVNYRTSELLKRQIPGWDEVKGFSEKLDLLHEKLVYEPDRQQFYDDTRRERILEKFNESDTYYVNVRLFIDGEVRYYQIQFSAVRDEGRLLGFVAGLHSIDGQMKKEIEAKRQLEDALSMAESASRAKTTFLNNMSHDIRTPMNAIIGYTGLAASHIDSKELVRDYLTKIGQSSNHLLSLINDVLDMSRIESGKMNLSEDAESIPEIIHTLHDIVIADVRSRRQEFFIDSVNVNDENIICDKLRLNQVLLNILSNSIKYTEPGGTVSMRIIEREVKPTGYAAFEFHIKDNGMGMSKEFLKTIFDPFTRVRSTTVSGIQGTGLGMAITKNIVDMMGGRIEIDSELGKGTETRLYFDFKLESSHKEPMQIAELSGLRALVADDDLNTCLSVSDMLRDTGMRPEWCTSGHEAVIRATESRRLGDLFKVYIIDWLMPDLNGIETTKKIREAIGDDTPIIIFTTYDWSDIADQAREAGVTAFISKPLFPSSLKKILNQCLSKKEDEPEQVAPEYDFSGKKVLVVEDNQMNREIATELLEEEGFVVDVAEDGDIAVDRMKSAKAGDYDLVLMDIQMPTMDGYEATRRIRALGTEISRIPILAMTANAFEEDRKRALEAGMDEHIAKPINMAKLKETLAGFLP